VRATLVQAVTTEPRRARWVAQRPTAYRYALAAVCLGAFMGQLDASIVTVALPSMQRDLHASVGAVAWVGLGYLVALVATVAAVGRLSDRFGRKLVYLQGFCVFTLSSACCAFAPDLGWLVGMRVVQGVGAAMLQANSVALVALAVPRERLGRALGVQGAAQALGLAAGPSLGGVLLALGGWRLLFLVNVPTGLVAIGLAWLLVPRSRDLHEGVALDARGVVLFASCAAALLVLLTLGAGHELGAVGLVVIVAASVALAAAFWRHERSSTSPLLNPSVLARRAVRRGLLGATAASTALFGVLVATPFLLERSLRVSVLVAGMSLAAMPVALGVTAPIAGRVAERTGPRRVAAVGGWLLVVGLLVLAWGDGSVATLLPGLCLTGVALGSFMPATNASVMVGVPPRCAAAASALLNMARAIGTALGLAMTSLVLGLVAGASSASDVSSAYRATALLLAGVALIAVWSTRHDETSRRGCSPSVGAGS